jgi:hypothetical protein
MLLPGYPLRFDLVSVPSPYLGDDALGLGDRLPRAIPLDGFVAVVSAVLPDWWVTQFLALLALALAGLGVGLLTPAPLPGRLVAVLVAEWNPFVIEQLAIGHVPHLFAYSALPWIAVCARRLARGRQPLRSWSGLAAAGGFASLTPGGGALAALTTLAALLSTLGRSATRPATPPAGSTARPVPAQVPAPAASHSLPRAAAALATIAVLQLPWLVAALAAPGFSSSGGDSGVTVFALRSETGWGRLIDAAGLGGMWNGFAVPASRSTLLAGLSTVLLLALAVAAVPAVRRSVPGGVRRAAVGAVLVSYLIAVLPVLPGGTGLLEGIIEVVPGAGLLRDGHRWLAVPALVLAVLAGLGVSELGRRLPPPGSVAVAVLAAFLVVASLPDAAFGLDGRLRAWHYPGDWASVRTALDRSDDRARVLVLPWQPFRKFPWSGPDAVLDPAPRLLPRQSIVSDALTVGGTELPPEGPGSRAITADLADGRLSQEQLTGLAIGWILIERDTPGPVPELPPGWTPVVDGPDLTLLRGPGALPAAPRASAGRTFAVVGAQVLAGLLLLTGLLGVIGGYPGRNRRNANRGTGDITHGDHART